jgi:hypothetical protein
MNHRWLLILNNLSGISYVQIFTKQKWKESKLLRIYAFIKLLVVVLCFFLIYLNSDKIRNIVRAEDNVIKNYSKFSKYILFISINFYHISGFSVLIFQYIRRHETTKFLKIIDSFELTKESNIKLKKKCIINTLFNVGGFLVGVMICNVLLFDSHYALSYVLYYEVLITHIAILAIINFFCNFQQLILTNLKEVKEDLNNYFWSESFLNKSLEKLEKIEKCFEIFEKTFGFQLTLVTVNCVFSFVTFVSMSLELEKSCIMSFGH